MRCQIKCTLSFFLARSAQHICSGEQSKRNYVNRHHRLFVHMHKRHTHATHSFKREKCREQMHRRTLTWINKGNCEINHNVKHCIQWNTQQEIWVTIGRVTVLNFFFSAAFYSMRILFDLIYGFELLLFCELSCLMCVWCVLRRIRHNHWINWNAGALKLGPFYTCQFLRNIYDFNGLTYDLCTLCTSVTMIQTNRHNISAPFFPHCKYYKLHTLKSWKSLMHAHIWTRSTRKQFINWKPW